MSETLNALVLAGGRSRRLGRDKVALPVGGRPLLARTVALAARHAARVWVSGRDPGPLGLETPWLPDDTPGMGPLGGILTGLRHVGGPLLVLACDLPLLDDSVVGRLVAGRAARPAGAVMTTFRDEPDGRIEPLVAVYEQAAGPLLAAAAARGLYALARAVPPPARHHLPRSPREADAFLNINFPADLERLAELLPGEGRP